MQQQLFLSRHGLREDWGPKRKEWLATAPRPHDPSLSPEGFEQAKELANFYKTLHTTTTPFHRILASPLVRTLQTASAIAEQLDLPIGLEFGAFEWLGDTRAPPEPLPVGELVRLFPRIDPTYASTVSPPSQLTEEQMHAWCKDAIHKIVQRFPNETTLIITHAAPLIALARGLVDPKLLVRTGVCSVTKLVLHDSSSSTENGDKPQRQQEKGQGEVDLANTNFVSGKWVVEINGTCAHLSKGEQYHWSF